MLKLSATARSFAPGGVLKLARMPLFRNAYALILNSVATSGLGIVYWVLAARLYSTELVGVNSALISAMMLLSTISRVNLGEALLRFVPSAGTATLRLVGGAYLVSLALALAVGLLLFGALSLVPDTLSFLRGDLTFMLVVVLCTMAWSIFGLQDYVLTGARQAVWVPFENAAFALLKIVLLVAFVGVFGRYGIFASWTIPVVLSLLPVNFLIFRYVVPRHARTRVPGTEPIQAGPVAKFALANYAGSLFWMAATLLLPILVTEMLGPKANAYFYQPWLVASSLQLIASNMGMSLTVEAARDPQSLMTYSRHVLTHTLKLLVPAVGGIVLAAPFLLRLFGSDYESQGTLLLQLLSLAAFPYLIMKLYLSQASVRNNIKGLMGVQAVFCMLVLGLSIALMPLLGIAGVGWGWLIAQSLVALWLLATRLRGLVRPERNTST